MICQQLQKIGEKISIINIVLEAIFKQNHSSFRNIWQNNKMLFTLFKLIFFKFEHILHWFFAFLALGLQYMVESLPKDKSVE